MVDWGIRKRTRPSSCQKSKHEAEFMNRRSTLLIAVAAVCIAVAMLPTSAFAISRDLVISRGKVWVNYTYTDPKTHKKVTSVPYSQSRWAYESGALIPAKTSNPSSLGYRTDCSGFASMCMNLRDSKGHPYSATTAEFGAKGSKKYVQIAKSQLLPGDMILKSTVWGAPVGHAIIFAGWVDAAQTKFWALEQTSSSSHNGTILHSRAYGQPYFRPYRYVGLDDPYADVLESVNGSDPYRSAAAAADITYPPTQTVTVPALVIAAGSKWGDQVVASELAGQLHGPALLSATGSLPASTTAEIKRLKPSRIIMIGSSATLSKSVQSQLASLCPSVSRVEGNDLFNTSANALKTTIAEAKANGVTVTVAYVVSGDQPAAALSIAPVINRAPRPMLFVHANTVPSSVLSALKASHVKNVVILGGTKTITTTVEKALKKAGCTTSRIAGADKYKTSLAIAKHALSLNLGFGWKRLGVGSPSSTLDAFAWGSSNGANGSLFVLTPAASLDANVRKSAAAHRTEIGKARVFGGAGAVSQGARKTLAVALRTGK